MKLHISNFEMYLNSYNKLENSNCITMSNRDVALLWRQQC